MAAEVAIAMVAKARHEYLKVRFLRGCDSEIPPIPD